MSRRQAAPGPGALVVATPAAVPVAKKVASRGGKGALVVTAASVATAAAPSPGPARVPAPPPPRAVVWTKIDLVAAPPVVLCRAPACAAPFGPVGANVDVTTDPYRVVWRAGGAGRGAWAAVHEAVHVRGITAMKFALDGGCGSVYVGVARPDALQANAHPMFTRGGCEGGARRCAVC